MKTTLITLLIISSLTSCVRFQSSRRNYGIVTNVTKMSFEHGCDIEISFGTREAAKFNITSECDLFKVGDTILLFNIRTDTTIVPYKK